MKLITAIIETPRLDELRDALLEIGVQGLTICRVPGCTVGDQRPAPEASASTRVISTAWVKVEILAADAMLERALDTIVQTVQTGTSGDGKIFVRDAEQTVRIRTCEIGEAALS